jgi:hypothetical protein
LIQSADWRPSKATSNDDHEQEELIFGSINAMNRTPCEKFGEIPVDEEIVRGDLQEPINQV